MTKYRISADSLFRSEDKGIPPSILAANANLKEVLTAWDRWVVGDTLRGRNYVLDPWLLTSMLTYIINPGITACYVPNTD